MSSKSHILLKIGLFYLKGLLSQAQLPYGILNKLTLILSYFFDKAVTSCNSLLIIRF